MKPNDLIGMEFNIPVFSAFTQEYRVREAMEIWPGRWEFRFDYIKSNYSVPEKIKIEVDKNSPGNGKKIFTLSEYNNRTGAVNQLNTKIIEDSESNTMADLKKVFFALGAF